MRLPMIAGFGDCPAVSSKAGLALAHTDRGIPRGPLCLSGRVLFHRWSCNTLAHPPLAGGAEIPMVWGLDKNGYDYLGCFVDFLDDFQNAFGRPYRGIVLCCNECDLQAQCDEPPENVAEIMLGIWAACPACQLVGPGTSKADDGQFTRLVMDEVWRRCGARGLCGAVQNRHIAFQQHVFPDPIPRFNDLETRFSIFCDYLYGEVQYYRVDGVLKVRRIPDGVLEPCREPIWPTVGWLDCAGSLAMFEGWIRWLEENEDIARYFVYTAYHEKERPCDFEGLMVYDAWPQAVRGRVGNAFVAGLTDRRPIVRFTADGYPGPGGKTRP